MTLEHRKADILNAMFQANLSNMVKNLATVMEENEKLRAQVKELEAKATAEPVAPTVS